MIKTKHMSLYEFLSTPLIDRCLLSAEFDRIPSLVASSFDAIVSPISEPELLRSVKYTDLIYIPRGQQKHVCALCHRPHREVFSYKGAFYSLGCLRRRHRIHLTTPILLFNEVERFLVRPRDPSETTEETISAFWYDLETRCRYPTFASLNAYGLPMETHLNTECVIYFDTKKLIATFDTLLSYKIDLGDYLISRLYNQP